jgi:DNA-3-methyladenine glycosylase
MARRAVPPGDTTPAPLSRRSLPSGPADLARWLIGKRILRVLDGELLGGRIVETEAYLADDCASHSFRGLTARNASMFAARGHAYVYRIYGTHFCFNVSAGPAAQGAAVLIRALAPQFGVDAMRARRNGARDRDIARGPGRLCAALHIDLSMDGVDLCGGEETLWLANGDAPGDIGVSTRIGITKAAEMPLRFYERGNFHVSGPKSLRS